MPLPLRYLCARVVLDSLSFALPSEFLATRARQRFALPSEFFRSSFGKGSEWYRSGNGITRVLQGYCMTP